MMTFQGFNLRIAAFLFLIMVGAALFAVSLTSLAPTPFMAKGIRSLSFLFLFLGTGEFLNHPLQKKPVPPDRATGESHIRLVRLRNPCALGNTLDVLALVCLFVALSFFFFPYQH